MKIRPRPPRAASERASEHGALSTGPIASSTALAGALLACCLWACGEAEPSASVQPGQDLPGRETTNSLRFGANACLRPADHTSRENRSLFFAGNAFFNQSGTEAPSSNTARDGLGRLFNARACSACHFKDGRGRPPLEEGEAFTSML